MKKLKLNIQLFGGSLSVTGTETDVSIENNTSYINVVIKATTNSTTYNDSAYLKSATLTGQNDTYTIGRTSFSIGKGQTVTVYNGKIGPFHHNADGSLNAVSISASAYIVSNTQPTASTTVTMSTIPRTSSFTISKTSGGAAATSWNLGEAIYVNITRASSSFTHKVYFVIGSSGNQVISNSAGTSANTTLASSLAQYIPSTSGTATMYVDTYNGSTKIGTATKTFTINVPSNVVPSISSVTKSDTAGYLSTYNAYVQGKSNLRVQTTASGNYSTISNYTVKLKNSGGTVLNTKTGNDVTFSNISYTGTITVEVTVTDSRNRAATNTSTITVASYENPKITTFTAERRNNDSTVTITYNASITNINSRNINAKAFAIYKRQKGTSSWGNAIASYTSGYTWNDSFTTTCDENYGWEFKLEAQDSFTTTSRTAEVGTAFELINWGANGTSMAIGKVSEKSNTLEVGVGTEFNSSIYVKDTTGSIDNGKYVASDFTNTFRDNLLGNNLTMIRKQGTWSSSYFPNYSCGVAWEKDSSGGFIIPSQATNSIYVGGVGSGIVNWTDEFLLKGHTALSNWTPTLSSIGETGPTTTYTSRSGKYCRLGNIVFFDFYIRGKITALNGTNNYASISGLPYAVASHGFGGQAANVGVVYSAINTPSTEQVTFLISDGAIHIQGGKGAGRSKWIVTTTSYMEVAGSGWYFVA